MTAPGSYWRDENFVPLVGHGVVSSKTLTFTGDGATVATAIFTVTGVVEVLKLWGIVTTALENHTDAHLRVNDQTASDQVLSKTTTLDLSDISVGAAIIKNGLAAAVMSYRTSDAGSILEPAVANEKSFSPVIIAQKTGSVQTDIEYVYTTTDSPTTGTMQFFVGYLPLSEGGKIAAS